MEGKSPLRDPVSKGRWWVIEEDAHRRPLASMFVHMYECVPYLQKKSLGPGLGMVTHYCSPSTWESKR